MRKYAAAILIFLTVPVLASATTTMTVSSTPLQYTITDLAPDDGIAAGLSDIQYLGQVAAAAYQPFSVESVVHTPVAQAVAATTVFGSSAASATGSAFEFQHSLSTSAEFAETNDIEHFWWSQVEQHYYFMLAPHTRLTITGQIIVTADVTYETTSEDSIASYGFNFCSTQTVVCRNTYFEFDAPGHYEHAFTVASFLQNNSDQASYAYFETHSSLLVTNPVAGVPEPAAILMLSVGLPLAAWASRRRKGRITEV